MKLHEYQNYSVSFVEKNPFSGLFLDMGLGKTLITLTAISELRDFGMFQGKVLVIAPKPVVENTWPREIKKWHDETQLSYSKVLGTESERIAGLKKQADMYLINVENVSWLVNYYGKKWPFEMVVIDEMSKFKSPKAKRFKDLRKVRPLIKRLIGLTGTPSPNTLLELWPQLYLLDQGKRLGRTITSYRDAYFKPDARNGATIFSWKLQPDAEEMIYQKISDICVSMKAIDYLKLPKRTDIYRTVELDDGQREKYDQLARDLVLPIADTEIVAASAGVLAGKLGQLANGAIYTDEEHHFIEFHDKKLDELEQLIEEANGQPVLIFYSYQHDLARIKKRIPSAQVFNSDLEPAWNAGKIPIMLAQPASTSYGLNLQDGGHIIIWFGLTWSLEQYQQANARILRQGQKNPVSIFHIVTKDTSDDDMLAALSGKYENQEQLLAALKARLTGI